MNHLRHSFVISTPQVALDLQGRVTAQVGSFHVSGFSAEITDLAGRESCVLSFETCRATAERAARNAAVIDGAQLVVHGSDMNTEAIYYVAHENNLVVFNDLFLARQLLPALGLRVVYENEGESAAHLTFFRGVSRLRAGERLAARTRNGTLVLQVERVSAILETSHPPLESVEQSTEALHDALDDAVRQCLAGAASVCIALSGGVDSGTIAALIKRHPVPLTAYSLSTEWGNELAQARETADHLGIELIPIHVSADEIRAEMPAVVRFFHFIEPENVEIALVAHCLYRKLYREDPRPRLFLTGYGSDLMNGGGVLTGDNTRSYHERILSDLQRTQLSNEFSGRDALQLGMEVRHPFWDSAVIACALRTPSSHKLRNGIDKFYLRQMLPGSLPQATAWRTKLGAHRGTGLATHLAAQFGGPTEYRAGVRRVHRDIFERGEYE